MTRVKVTPRKLEESSWLAQTIADMMRVESDKNGYTSKWACLEVLKHVVNEADDKDNPTIYYRNTDGKLEIVICKIPSLVQHGTDFCLEGMQNKLRGLAERYKDDDGNYTVSVKTTHDLNSATINVSGVMDSIRFGGD
jgi:hypothetical protein